MSKKELLAYLIENNTNISIYEIIIGMCVATFLAMYVYFIYKKTYSGVMYSKNFNITLVVISLITTMVIMIIGSNLALSLGMVGALSIIRFRTAVKEPKDSAYIFWSIAIGISCGTGIYNIAIIGSIVISIVLVLLNKGLYDDNTYLVIVHGTDNLHIEDVEAIINENTMKNHLKMQNKSNNKTDLTYEVKIKKNNSKSLVSKLDAVSDVFSVNVVEYNGEIAG